MRKRRIGKAYGPRLDYKNGYRLFNIMLSPEHLAFLLREAEIRGEESEKDSRPWTLARVIRLLIDEEIKRL